MVIVKPGSGGDIRNAEHEVDLSAKRVTLVNAGGSGNILGSNSLGADAWGRQKVVNDFSMFHGIWTFDVPNNMWVEEDDGVEIVKTNATSENGMLKLASNSNRASLFSKRHARYQPNRGHLYSTAVILPNPTADGIRRFGLIHTRHGMFFKLTSTGLFAVIRTYFNGVVTEDTQPIDTTGIDLSKGHVFDIQAQWRGVGGIRFFIDLVEVHCFDYLGTLTQMSVSNPATNIGFESENVTEDVVIYAGCVDITSEGGSKENRQYSSINNGMNISSYQSSNNGGDGTAMLAIRIPRNIIVNGFEWGYTRDVVLTRVKAFCKDEASTGVYYFRNNAVIDGLTWLTRTGNHLNYLIGGNGSALQTAFAAEQASGVLLTTGRSEIDFTTILDNPDDQYGDFFLTAGDTIVVCVVPDGNGKNTGVGIELGEEI